MEKEKKGDKETKMKTKKGNLKEGLDTLGLILILVVFVSIYVLLAV